MRINEVAGGGGLRLQVREWGRADGPPILLIHGWSQCHPCWARQYDSALADDFRLVALDLRGHDMSEAPLEQEHSTDPRLWADDVQPVIDGSPPRARCWSAGRTAASSSATTCAPTASRIAAIDLVGAAVTLGEQASGRLIGPGCLENFAGATADDLPTTIQALRAFIDACLAQAPAA